MTATAFGEGTAAGKRDGRRVICLNVDPAKP